MATDFQIFGAAHLAIIAAVPAVAAGLAWIARTKPALADPIRVAFAVGLLVNEIVWWTFKFSKEGWRFPEGMPLQLCDFSLWMILIAALTRRQAIYEIAYYCGIAGAGMAVVTPELWAPLFSYPSMYFFVAHGGIISLALYLAWSRLLRPGWSAIPKAFAALAAWACFVGTFDWIFGTNYMYLRHKPGSASALDAMGPWPWYIAVGALVGFLFFVLLGLPYRSQRDRVA